MHLTRDAIRTLLTEPARNPAPDHLALCTACGAIADEIALELGLDDALAWDLARLPEIPPDEGASELEMYATERLFVGGSGSELADDPRLGTDDGQLALLRASHALLIVDASRLRDIADAVLAGNRSDAVAVVALRERANALRRMGELPEALATVARGREVAGRLIVSEHELAIFDYIEATVLSDQSLHAPARELATRALATFTRYGDTRRALYSRLLLGAIEYESGAFSEARAIFQSLAAPLAAIGDRAAAVAVVQNAGDCSLQLKDLAPARRDLLAAELGYQQLGLTAEALSVKWLLGRVALEEGRYGDAELVLRAVAAEHDARALKLDAALARLDLVDLFGRTGRTGEAIELARTLASAFAAAGARGRLADAMAILREAVERGEAFDVHLREVREALSEATPFGFPA